jgi:hypothetical protein
VTEELVGKITHYFPNIAVAAATLSGELKVGDRVRVKGHTTDFTEAIESLQIEHQNVDRRTRRQRRLQSFGEGASWRSAFSPLTSNRHR